MAKAKNLKLAVTAGIGSDHVDLDVANKTNGGITVAEVTGSNVVSVAERKISFLVKSLSSNLQNYMRRRRYDYPRPRPQFRPRSRASRFR